MANGNVLRVEVAHNFEHLTCDDLAHCIGKATQHGFLIRVLLNIAFHKLFETLAFDEVHHKIYGCFSVINECIIHLYYSGVIQCFQ